MIKKPAYLTGKNLAIVSSIVIALTILVVWSTGLAVDRSIFENSLWSLSILAVVFFLFISISLYKGLTVKDDLGNLIEGHKWKLHWDAVPDGCGSGDVAFGEGIEGIIIGFVLSIIVSILVITFFVVFISVGWFVVLLVFSLLYWLFLRALRLVFRNANYCKGKLGSSLLYGFLYATLYTSWIYAIIFLVNYFK